MNGPLTIFEPWSLGDALIAAWAGNLVLKERPGSSVQLACASRFHEVLREIYPHIGLIATDLGYTGKAKKSLASEFNELRPLSDEPGLLLSIRGDPRDYLFAKRLFPRKSRHFIGWLPFVALRSRLVDFPFSRGWLPVANRYHQWARILDRPQAASKPLLAPTSNDNLRITVHVGAQWLSKRYPFARELQRQLTQKGHQVTAVRGPGDPPYEGLQTQQLQGKQVVDFLRGETDLLVCNDSAPVHLGFALSLPTVCIYGNTAAPEWKPPAVLGLGLTGGGYRRAFPYSVDLVTNPDIWVSPQSVLQRLQAQSWIQ